MFIPRWPFLTFLTYFINPRFLKILFQSAGEEGSFTIPCRRSRTVFTAAVENGWKIRKISNKLKRSCCRRFQNITCRSTTFYALFTFLLSLKKGLFSVSSRERISVKTNTVPSLRPESRKNSTNVEVNIHEFTIFVFKCECEKNVSLLPLVSVLSLQLPDLMVH